MEHRGGVGPRFLGASGDRTITKKVMLEQFLNSSSSADTNLVQLDSIILCTSWCGWARSSMTHHANNNSEQRVVCGVWAVGVWAQSVQSPSHIYEQTRCGFLQRFSLPPLLLRQPNGRSSTRTLTPLISVRAEARLCTNGLASLLRTLAVSPHPRCRCVLCQCQRWIRRWRCQRCGSNCLQDDRWWVHHLEARLWCAVCFLVKDDTLQYHAPGQSGMPVPTPWVHGW